jgi:hypothetical protein
MTPSSMSLPLIVGAVLIVSLSFIRFGTSGAPSLAPVFQDKTNHLVQAFVDAPLPRVMNASAESPVIFFHQAKTAGTAFRRALSLASLRLNLKSFIGCEKPQPCKLYSMRSAFVQGYSDKLTPPPYPSVFAGHFHWDDMSALSQKGRLLPTGKWLEPAAQLNFHCVTLFREPVARLESCYYYRFVAGLNITVASRRHACLSNLRADEMHDFFRRSRTREGFGCLNEPFRVMSGVRDETWLARLAGTDFHTVLEHTLAHVAQCVPLILEDPRTPDVVRHWMPQFAPEVIAQLSAPLERRALPGPLRGERPEKCPLNSLARRTLTELTAEETVLYEAATLRLGVMAAAIPARKRKL